MAHQITIRLRKEGKKMIDLPVPGTVRHEAKRLIKHISPEKGASALKAPEFQDN